jgi:Cu2+-exporting ATPase
MSKTLTCYHCLSSILPGEIIKVDLAGISRSFCCPGCMAIAKTIHGEGLEVFYIRRVQSGDKPATYLALTVNPAKTSFVKRVLL